MKPLKPPFKNRSLDASKLLYYGAVFNAEPETDEQMDMLWELQLVKYAYEFGYTLDYLQSLPMGTLALLEGYLDAKHKLERRAATRPKS